MKTFIIGIIGIALASAQNTLERQLQCSDAGASDTYTCSIPVAPAAYVTGQHYRFMANTANTGAATINFNSLGAKTIVKAAGGITTTLADNDIRAGQWVDLVYDGTNMQMQSTLGNAAGGGSSSFTCVDNSTGWSTYGTTPTITQLTNSAGSNCGVNAYITSGAASDDLRGRTIAASGTFAKKIKITFQRFNGNNAEAGAMIRDGAGKAIVCAIRFLATANDYIRWFCNQYSSSSTDAGDETVNSIWNPDGVTSDAFMMFEGAGINKYSPNVTGCFLLASDGTTETISWTFDATCETGFLPVTSSTYLGTVDGAGYAFIGRGALAVMSVWGTQ